MDYSLLHKYWFDTLSTNIAFLVISNLSEACRGPNFIFTKTKVLSNLVHNFCVSKHEISSHVVISMIYMLYITGKS